MDQRYNLYNFEPKFKDFLRAENISADTLKNYLSDIRHFVGWISNNLDKDKVSTSLDFIQKETIASYKEYLLKNLVPVITVNRRLSSLRKYFDFLVKEAHISHNPARLVHNIPKTPQLNKNKQVPDKPQDTPDIKVSKPDMHIQPESIRFNSSRFKLIQYGIIGIVFTFLLFNITSFLVNKFSSKNSSAAKVEKPKRGRILAFKGKLYDNLGNPITSKTDVAFRIYNQEKSSKPIYTGLCKGVNGVTPDFDGFTSVVIGKDCNMDPIPQSVFSENPGLYLGISIGSDKELEPRQQIANVSYSLDSERLQGMELGSSASSVPYIDDNGAIHIEASESAIYGHSPEGTFSIKSDGALSLESGDQNDIILTSGLSGSLKFKTGGFADSVSNLFIGSDGNVGISTEDASDFKLQVAGDVGPDSNDIFNLGSETKQWATIYAGKFLQNGVALCDEQGNNCPKNISSWTLSSPYLYMNQSNTKVGIGTSNINSIISKLFVTKDPSDNATGKALAIFDQTEKQDIIAASASGQTRFVVKYNGDTGVGTVNPSARLDVSGGQTKIEVSTQYTQRLCHSGSDTTSTQNVLIGDCETGGADIAEYYGSSDRTIEAGDIVIASNGGLIANGNSKAYVNKSDTAYDSRVIGVVSTKPYDSFGNNFSKDEYAFPVALGGRIPVKISKNSDVIKAGDLLTASAEPGKAMKAKQAGQIIGKALEDWSPEQDKNSILTFVNISWNDPSLSLNSTGEVRSDSTTEYVYNGILKKEENQIRLFNSIFERASEEEKNLLTALWQAKNFSAEKSGEFLDIAYSKAQNTILKIQNLIVAEKIQSPIVETTDLIATGSSRLANIHTNEINTDGKSIEINLDQPADSSPSATKGPLAELIIKGVNGQKAASIDAAGNATFSGTLAANSASISGELAARSITSDALNSQFATISGTLVADNIQSNTIRALEQRINSLSDSSKAQASLPASLSQNPAPSSDSAAIASNNTNTSTDETTKNSSFDTKEIQKLIAQIKNDQLADPQYYHVPDSIQNPSESITNRTITHLADEMEQLKLENLTVTGKANVYAINAAQSVTVGTTIIENDSILSLANNLNISALSTITLFDGAITIARDGTMTSKGAVIARGGVKTNTIEAIDHNVTVKLSAKDSGADKLVIANPAGSEVASIDASGSAQFDEISLSKYMEATDSGALISAEDNFEKRGLFAPAFNADKKAAGIGIVPKDSTEVIIYTDKIKEGSLVYLTPTEQLTTGQLSILEKESCKDKSDGCQPYFRVGISEAIHPELQFNWLIIN